MHAYSYKEGSHGAGKKVVIIGSATAGKCCGHVQVELHKM